MVPYFVARTGGSEWLSALPAASNDTHITRFTEE